MPYKLTFAILVSIFWLTACGSQAQSAATAAPSQTVIASSTQPFTQTAKPIATATPSQTVIASPTQPFTQTAEPIDTPTLHPPTPKPDEIEEFPDDCFVPYYSVRETSPDGQWVARVCERTNQDGSLDDTFPPIDLHIRKQDGSKEWKVSFKDLTDVDFITYTNKYGEDARFVSAPIPYHWYKDSRYLFIVPQVEIDSYIALGLYRFDTQTGRISAFLPTGESSYDFAFSPDDEYYVYQYGKDKKYIHIASLESGKDQAIRLPVEKAYARNFIWAPDSTKFVFIYYNAVTKKSSLVLFDTIQNAYIPLLEIDETRKYNLDLIEWVSNAQVKIRKELSYYLLNVETKELQPISTKQAP